MKDLYPSEAKAVQGIMHLLKEKHSFKGVKTIDQEDAIKRVFEVEAQNRCAEIGLIATVQWDPECSDDPNDWNLYWNPRLIISGRTQKLDEIDHDRMSYEVTHGVADGQAGYIREDGSKHEEPKRKDIF